MTDADLKQLGRWLIHDSGRGWFISSLRGYTVLLGKAGRFSWEEALSYAFPEGWNHPRSGVTLQHEATVFEPTAAPTQEVLALRAEVARLREALRPILSRLANDTPATCYYSKDFGESMRALPEQADRGEA